jgi:hypothetical protein
MKQVKPNQNIHAAMTQADTKACRETATLQALEYKDKKSAESYTMQTWLQQSVKNEPWVACRHTNASSVDFIAQ